MRLRFNATEVGIWLDFRSFCNFFQRILSLQLCKLLWKALIEEFVDFEESASTFDLNCITHQFNDHRLGSELVNTRRLPVKHNLQPFTVRIVVNKFCHFKVDLVAFNRNINCNSLFEIKNILFQSLIFCDKFEHFFVCIEASFLKTRDVGCSAVQLTLKMSFLGEKSLVFGACRILICNSLT